MTIVRLLKLIFDFAHDKRAVTAIEYGLIIGMISLAMVLTLSAMGTNLAEFFEALTRLLFNAAEEPDPA